MSLRTRVASILTAAAIVVSGGLMSLPAQAVTSCNATCVIQQLASHAFTPVPTGDGVRTVAADGSMLYYTGPNGLEIRLSHDMTTEVIEDTYYTTTAAIGLDNLLFSTGEAAASVKIFPAWVAKAASAAGILQGYIQNIRQVDFTALAIKAMRGDLCLGATIEPNSVKGILDRTLAAYVAILQQNPGGVAKAEAGIKAVWFEPCSLNAGQLSDAVKPSTLADLGLNTVQLASAPTSYTYTVYHTGGVGLKERTAPNTSGGVIRTIPEGGSVAIVCQVHGQRVVAETDIWDRTTDGRYVYDEYVSTPNIGTFSIRQC